MLWISRQVDPRLEVFSHIARGRSMKANSIRITLLHRRSLLQWAVRDPPGRLIKLNNMFMLMAVMEAKAVAAVDMAEDMEEDIVGVAAVVMVVDMVVDMAVDMAEDMVVMVEDMEVINEVKTEYLFN